MWRSGLISFAFIWGIASACSGADADSAGGVRCGEGTELRDGECVIAVEASAASTSSTRSTLPRNFEDGARRNFSDDDEVARVRGYVEAVGGVWGPQQIAASAEFSEHDCDSTLDDESKTAYEFILTDDVEWSYTMDLLLCPEHRWTDLADHTLASTDKLTRADVDRIAARVDDVLN